MGKITITEEIDKIIDIALAEDTGYGDVTTEALIPPSLQGNASVLIKGDGVLAGIEVAMRVFQKIDPSLKIEVLIKDGSKVKPGDTAATVSGSVSSILKAERVAINFLCRLSGIASETARYVDEVRGLNVNIYDTRKTTPGLRLLEKYAVRVGGGKNHRYHLGDGILIKDNHIAALRARGVSLKDIVSKARRNAPGVKVEIEVTSRQETLEAIEGKADTIMLDNMAPHEMREMVALIAGRARVEAAGGITLANIREVAAAGVDIISVGALTHSVKALDISLEIEPETLRLR